jgi:hypothetical protein
VYQVQKVQYLVQLVHVDLQGQVVRKVKLVLQDQLVLLGRRVQQELTV